MELDRYFRINHSIDRVSAKAKGVLTKEDRDILVDGLLEEFESTLKNMKTVSSNSLKGTLSVNLSGYSKAKVKIVLKEAEYQLGGKVSFKRNKRNPKLLDYKIKKPRNRFITCLKEFLEDGSPTLVTLAVCTIVIYGSVGLLFLLHLIQKTFNLLIS